MQKYNVENLTANQRTPNERRESAKKAGVASGEARRRKKTMAQLINQYLSFKVKDPKKIKQLKEEGFNEEELDNKTMLMMSIVKNATKGNVKFAALALKISKDDELIELEKKRLKKEIQEADVRIERQKLENQRLKSQVEEKNDCEDLGNIFKTIVGKEYDVDDNPSSIDEEQVEQEEIEEESSVVMTNE